MAHLKCLACKTRLQSTESPADPIGDLCPVCGSLLEPVGDLGEIVGYRVIESPVGSSHSGASRGPADRWARRRERRPTRAQTPPTSRARNRKPRRSPREPTRASCWLARSGTGDEAVRRRV
jgi:hypothetical protein